MADETNENTVNENDMDTIIDLSDCFLKKSDFEDMFTEHFNSIMKKIYPIGSIYMSIDDVNPNELFGGTWIKIENRFLLASGSKNIGITGGEETHILNTNELPKHNHTIPSHTHTSNPHAHTPPGNDYYFITAKQSDGSAMDFWIPGTYYSLVKLETAGNSGRSLIVSNDDGYIYEPRYTEKAQSTINAKESFNTTDKGNNEGHNNMPPYLVVNIWQKTGD